MSLEDSEGPDIIAEFDDDPWTVTVQPESEFVIITMATDEDGVVTRPGLALMNLTKRAKSYFVTRRKEGILITAVTSSFEEKV